MNPTIAMLLVGIVIGFLVGSLFCGFGKAGTYDRFDRDETILRQDRYLDQKRADYEEQQRQHQQLYKEPC